MLRISLHILLMLAVVGSPLFCCCSMVRADSASPSPSCCCCKKGESKPSQPLPECPCKQKHPRAVSHASGAGATRLLHDLDASAIQQLPITYIMNITVPHSTFISVENAIPASGFATAQDLLRALAALRL